MYNREAYAHLTDALEAPAYDDLKYLVGARRSKARFTFNQILRPPRPTFATFDTLNDWPSGDVRDVAFEPKHTRLTSPSFDLGPDDFGAAVDANAREHDLRFNWTDETRRSTPALIEISKARRTYKTDKSYLRWYSTHGVLGTFKTG